MPARKKKGSIMSFACCDWSEPEAPGYPLPFANGKGAARALVKGKVISHPARTPIIAARPHICFLFFDRNNCFLREIHMNSSFAGHRALQQPLLMCDGRPVNIPRFSVCAKSFLASQQARERPAKKATEHRPLPFWQKRGHN